MRDYIDLVQTTPNDEPCAQIGHVDYHTMARIEANVFIGQLQRTLGMNPAGTRFRIIQCPHDFGVYLDIRFHYDDEIDLHYEYMCKLERACDKWDTHAIQELQQRGYSLDRTKVIKLVQQPSDDSQDTPCMSCGA